MEVHRIVKQARSTLYAADNAGEIVFDRVIARHLGVEEGGIILMKGEKNAELLQ